VNLSTVCKYIDVRELGWAEEQIKETINKLRAEFGVNVVTIGSKELIEVYNSINAKEANKWAVQWVSKAKAVVEPSEREILDAAKMYLAMRKLIEKYAAIGITIDCIVLPYLKRLPAYPCLGYAQLLDEGFIATCEADLDSAFTQLVIKYVTGEPGFVSNPVVDQTSGWVVYSHCVSATKIRGPDATSEPYRIRSHAEDRAGASLQVLWPPNEIVTAVKFNIREKKMAIHSGKIVGNIEEEKGCRTKVAVETNVDAILKNWNRQGKFGWHRVIVLGDWKNYLINFARLTGFKVIDELKN
jgi:L-fucose isomerase-like protein